MNWRHVGKKDDSWLSRSEVRLWVDFGLRDADSQAATISVLQMAIVPVLESKGEILETRKVSQDDEKRDRGVVNRVCDRENLDELVMAVKRI